MALPAALHRGVRVSSDAPCLRKAFERRRAGADLDVRGDYVASNQNLLIRSLGCWVGRTGYTSNASELFV